MASCKESDRGSLGDRVGNTAEQLLSQIYFFSLLFLAAVDSFVSLDDESQRLLLTTTSEG